MATQVPSAAKASRSLVFSDGSSNKFWQIELDGSSHTVTFGRVGTAGQTQTKEFGSDDAARKAYDKLVAEKTKKGYVDAQKKAGTKASSSAVVKKSTVAVAKGSVASSKSAAKPEVERTSTKKSKERNAVEAAAEAGRDTAAENEVDLSVTREIDLPPNEWLRLAVRRGKKLERGTAVEFDKEACVQRLAQLMTDRYGWEVRWRDLILSPALSPMEAEFWLVAMSEPRSNGKSLKAFAEKIGKKKINGTLTLEEARKFAHKTVLPKESATPLANLLSLDEHVELMLATQVKSKQPWQDSTQLLAIVGGFNKYVVPYLTEPQRESIRKRIRKNWDPHQQPANYCDCYPAEYYLAAGIGMPDAIYEVVSHWESDRFVKSPYSDYYQQPHEIVFGLASAEIIAAEWRRLKLKMNSAELVYSFLACTEYVALDCVVESIFNASTKEACVELLNAFAVVRAPEAAEPMLQCKLSAKTPAAARDWLDKNVGRAVTGLLDVAGGRGKLADAAMEYLRGVKRRGLQSAIEAAVKKAGKSDAASKVRTEVIDYEEKVYEPFDARSTPKWLAKEIGAAGTVKRRPLPAWATPAMLPPLIVDDRRFNDEQVELVLQLLAATPVGEKQPLLAALRTNISKAVRDEFVWKLFQYWQEEGFPSKEKWAMGTIAHLGDDHCVLKLTPLIRIWPGESQHARAVLGLECLRAIGSSISLMQLAGIAQKLKFKGLKTKAEQFVTEIAKERGLTREELEDRVVPDCGLDENGRRDFSFGPRSFAFVLGGDLKAMVRDESGKLRPNLPDPGSKDDQALAAESCDEWKLLKKQIKEVATIQAGRLEQAMVTGRRWNAEDFITLLVRHPLMTHLAQKLIWGGFDAKGKRVVNFRVTEERDLANPKDDAVTLDGVATVGVVHPLELTEAERERWGEVLGDYEIVSPFPQLGRAVYSLEAGEGKADELKRFHGLKLVAPTLVFTLEKLGWTRGVGMDGGGFDEHSKQFPAANVTAVIGYEGNVGMGYIDPNEMLKLTSVHFCVGMRPPSGYGWHSKVKMNLQKVPPIVISEVVADLQVIKSKAK